MCSVTIEESGHTLDHGHVLDRLQRELGLDPDLRTVGHVLRTGLTRTLVGASLTIEMK